MKTKTVSQRLYVTVTFYGDKQSLLFVYLSIILPLQFVFTSYTLVLLVILCQKKSSNFYNLNSVRVEQFSFVIAIIQG